MELKEYNSNNEVTNTHIIQKKLHNGAILTIETLAQNKVLCPKCERRRTIRKSLNKVFV